MTTRRRVSPLAAVALIALLLVVVGVTPAVSQKPMTIRIGVHTSIMGAPDVIAIRQGYFKQEGLNPEWRRFALGKDGRDAMIAGAIDINATAPVPFLIGLERGVPYVAIGVNSHFCGSNQLVVLKSSDLNNVAQLKGKRIGLPKGTITEFIFQSKIAPSHGLKPGDYQIANIPDAKDRVPSMVAKAVDMTALGDPFVAVAEQEGVIRILEDFCKYDPLPFMMTATTKIVQENPDAVVAYLRGWLRAIKLLKEEPEKAAQVYLDDLKSQGKELALPVLDKALRRMRWEPEITPAMDKYLLEMAKDMVAATSGDRLKAVPDLAKGVNKELMKKAMAGR